MTIRSSWHPLLLSGSHRHVAPLALLIRSRDLLYGHTSHWGLLYCTASFDHCIPSVADYRTAQPALITCIASKPIGWQKFLLASSHSSFIFPLYQHLVQQDSFFCPGVPAEGFLCSCTVTNSDLANLFSHD